MLITCWSVKGGSGTTVVAAALALLRSGPATHTRLVDLGGDGPAVLGLPEPAGPGVGDWLGAPADVGADALTRLAVPVAPGLVVIPRGRRQPSPNDRWDDLAAALAEPGEPTVVVDAGPGLPPAALRDRATHDVLVVRPCYLALRRAARLSSAPSAVVLVGEPKRALGRTDVEHAVGAPVVAELEWDPDVARAVDAGLLAARLPRSVRAALAVGPWNR